jgi:hypothetical protein
MTSVWGPLGWMTLHSMASLYPDEPTGSEKALMNSWLDLFASTITCPSCQGHFQETLEVYRSRFPGMLESRAAFLMFTFRVHNSVNQRLRKPIYSTVAECFEVLRNNVKTRFATHYRQAYYAHITRHWKVLQDASGMAALRRIADMNKIEATYALARSNEFTELIPEGLTMIGKLEAPPEGIQSRSMMPPSPLPNQKIGIQGGRFRLRK